MSIVRFVVVAGALALSVAAPAFAQTTGQIVGLVADATGAGVPTVAVTATSPQLPGSLTVLTDGSGRYALFALPPGTYAIQAVLTGFQTTQQSDVLVTLGQTSTVNLKLLSGEATAASGTSGRAPTSIDIRATDRVIAISGDGLADLPTPRDLTAIVRLAPLAHLDDIRIDGLRVGLDRGMAPESVDAAMIADGRLTTLSSGSGAVDVITRAGGNTIRGEIFAFGTGKGLTAVNKTQSLLPRTSTQIEDVRRDVDAGGVVGGYLAKDKAWFFGGYDEARTRRAQTVVRATPGSPAAGTRMPLESTRRVALAKLTLKLDNHQRLTGSINGDPSATDGPLFPIAGPSSTWLGTLDAGGIDASLRYDGVFGNRWLLEALYGRHNEKTTYGGAGTSIPALLDQTRSPVAVSGGFPFFQNRDLARDEASVKLSKSIHAHVVQAGLQYERLDALVTSFSGGGGQRVDKAVLPVGLLYYQHRYYNPTPNQVAASLASEPIDRDTALYVEDSWTVTSRLTLTGGVRWNRQDVSSRGGASTIRITGNWAGRFGGTWATLDGKSKIVAHAGRFFDRLPLELSLRAFGGESWCLCSNFSPVDVAAPVILIALPGASFGGTTRVEPSLRGQFTDEYAVGYERELAPSLVLSGRYTHRALGRAIEDVRGPAGEFMIVNPSKGSLGRTLSFLDGTTVAAPAPRRVSHRVEASARRTFSGGWQMIATYAWSKLDGNYDGPALSIAAPSEMNLTPSFDYGDFLINADGRLSNDRPHLLKLDASYTIHREDRLNGLTVGVSALSISGTPQTAYGYSAAYQNWNYRLMPRGDFGRAPTNYETDLHVGYPLHLGTRASLQVTADLFNLFNRQSVIEFDQRYNLSSSLVCAGIPEAFCNGDGGLLHKASSLTPADQLVGAGASTNPDFLVAGVRFTGPFSARLGVKLRF